MKKILLIFLLFGLTFSSYSYDRKSIVERFTNASCGPCAVVNNSWYNNTVANLIQSGTISHIIYHVWWPGPNDPMYLLNQSDNTIRTNYYSVNGVPDIIVNGTRVSTSTSTATMNAVNSGNSEISPFKIVLIQRALSDNLIEVGVRILRDPNDHTTFTTTKLKVGITEKMVYFQTPPGTNGEAHFSSATRKMLPDANGTTITIPAPGDSVEYILQYVPTAAFLQAVNTDSLRIVAFIQNETNKYIYQSEMLEFIPDYVAQINPQSPDIIADNNTPATFNSVIKNIGMKQDVYNINCSLTAPGSWTGEFTTANGTFPFGTLDSIQVNPGDSAVIQVSVNPQGTDGYGKLSVEFESKNNPGLSNSADFNFVTNSGIDVLVVRAGGSEFDSYVSSSIENVYNGTYGLVSRAALEPAGVDLSNFGIMVWQSSNAKRAFYMHEVTKLENYLNDGGNLLITGQNIGSDIFGTSGGSQFAQDFYHNYLHANYVADVSNLFIIKGIPGDIISNGVQIIANAVYPRSLDIISPRDTSAVSFLQYFNGPNIAGIRAIADNYRIIYMVAGFEQINEQAIRDTLASRCLNWLSENVVGIDDQGSLPLAFDLKQNYPNPFNPSTKIAFTLSEKSLTTLKVYDILGNEIITLINEEKPAGTYEVNFDASKLSSGVYLYKLQSNGLVQTRKMLMLK
ncbi:MAG: T9SS type A sorting domain-containing protein [Ignavibacteriaceae bacterium]